MASSLMEIYRRIVEEEITFTLKPQAPTDEKSLQDLIRRMLDKDPHKRATLRDVMKHPWVTLNGTVPLEPTEYKVRLLLFPTVTATVAEAGEGLPVQQQKSFRDRLMTSCSRFRTRLSRSATGMRVARSAPWTTS